MGIFTTIFANPTRLSVFTRGNGIKVSKKLVESGQAEASAVLEKMNTTPSGLTGEEAEAVLNNMVQMRSQRKNIRPCSCAFGTMSKTLW